MMKASNVGKGSIVNIGLMDLAQAAQKKPQMFVNKGGERTITIKDV